MSTRRQNIDTNSLVVVSLASIRELLENLSERSLASSQILELVLAHGMLDVREDKGVVEFDRLFVILHGEVPVLGDKVDFRQ